VKVEGTGPVAVPVFEVDVEVDVVVSDADPVELVLVEGAELDVVEVDGPVPVVEVDGEEDVVVVVTPPLEVLVVGDEVAVVLPERAA
jgi:hypothetical protein